ncbi:hypothetical protein AN189_04985 [Loktanella sp. 3ANDIMAR09]|nr:hypothetical protein AN189_04985 [Loktanella sp. 3ANDIMAR09]
MMSSQAWTDAENDLIVADYFAMQSDDVAGRPYNKAEHRRLARSALPWAIVSESVCRLIQTVSRGSIPRYRRGTRRRRW